MSVINLYFFLSMCKNALSRLFDAGVNQASPVQKDFVQVQKRDEDGNIFTVYEEFDYSKLQASLGFVSDWSLNNLLRAGVNPQFTIHTGNPTRLEGSGAVARFAEQAESIISDSETPKTE